jgi:hypothetical protein
MKKLTAAERHNQAQLMRVISHTLASKLKNLVWFQCRIPPVDADPRARFIVIALRYLHWVHPGAARRSAARNRKKK